MSEGTGVFADLTQEAVETACAALAVNVLKGNVDQVEALMVVRNLPAIAGFFSQRVSGIGSGVEVHDAAGGWCSKGTGSTAICDTRKIGAGPPAASPRQNHESTFHWSHKAKVCKAKQVLNT